MAAHGQVAGHTYTLALHFAELYFEEASSRVFTVIANGDAVLQDLDIFAEAGRLRTRCVF